MIRALVVGGANGFGNDVRAALELFEPDVVYVCNDMGVSYQSFDYWVTLHPEKMAKWKKERAQLVTGEHPPTVGPLWKEVGTEPKKFAHTMDRQASYRWHDGQRSSGSTGLFAAKVALDDGCTHVVLAGVPMSAKAGHHFRRGHWKDCDAFLPMWRESLPYIRDRVRSMSGWTLELLGRPTPTWLVEGSRR